MQGGLRINKWTEYKSKPRKRVGGQSYDTSWRRSHVVAETKVSAKANCWKRTLPKAINGKEATGYLNRPDWGKAFCDFKDEISDRLCKISEDIRLLGQRNQQC